MPLRPRPLLAVRLIGPSDHRTIGPSDHRTIVTARKTYLVSCYAKVFRENAVCRTSTHPAGNIGEIRVYLTVSSKADPPR